MLGALIIVVVLVVVIPVGVLVSGGVLSGLVGHFLTEHGEATNEGSELIALNR